MQSSIMTNPTKELTLSAIYQRFKGKVIATISLLVFENLLLISLPFLLGLAIDGLLNGQQKYLIVLACMLALVTLLGTLRRFYDTRAYSKITATLAKETAENQLAQGQSLSKTNTRVEMVSELVEFFEYELVESINALIKLAGALIMLAYFHVHLLYVALASTLAIVSIYLISSKHYMHFNKAYNDQHEKQVDVLTAQKNRAFKQHFMTLAKFKIKLSDLEALNFAWVFIFISLLIVINLMIAAQVTDMTTGGLFSVLSYTWEFAEVAIVLPLAYQQWIRSKEISTRIQC